MLLAGDEFGRTQKGNNNGYCQDSEISWINWEGLSENDEKLRDFTRRLIALRAEQPLLRRANWRDGLEIRWFNAGGIWHDVLMLFNPFEGTVPFQIPQFGEGGWVLELSTADDAPTGEIITESVDYELAGRSITLFRRP